MAVQQKKLRVPSLRHCNGRGFVELDGERVYLGPWGAPETERAYRRSLAEYVANGRRAPASTDELTVVELCERYWTHAKDYYKSPEGDPTSTLDRVRQALRPLIDLYGDVPAQEFGPNSLRAVQEGWIERGLSRKTINDYVAVIKATFKWATSFELISVSIYQRLLTLPSLHRGRSRAIEPDPVTGVSLADIEAVKPYVSRQVLAMIQLQLLTAARSGEIVRLRPIDLRTSEEPWIYEVARHKTRHLNKKRTIAFGPQAQEVLRPFLPDRPVTAPCFSPKEAERERHAAATVHRRANQSQAPRRTDRVIGDAYTTGSYCKAVKRACDRAGIPAWTPHQLRHTAATAIRAEFGVEAAQVALGHSHIAVTELYAEADQAKAKAIAKKIG